MGSKVMGVKRRYKRQSRWRRYEAGKKAIAARGLPHAEHEKAIKDLARKCGL